MVAYSPEQLFDLVADVGQYPRFLPWCVAARVRSRTETEMVADMTIGFGPFRETFTSRVALERPFKLNVSYENGPFRFLHNRWEFIALGQGGDLSPVTGPGLACPGAMPRHDTAIGSPQAAVPRAVASRENGTEVDFFVDFEFRSRILQAAIGLVFHEAVRRMVDAFLKRAAVIYGAGASGASLSPVSTSPGTAG